MLFHPDMKKYVTALLISAVACLAGCLDADDRSTSADAVDAQPSFVDDEGAAALVAAPASPEGACDTVTDPAGVAQAPCCGGGHVYYFEWVCTLRGWKQVEVGRQKRNCSTPYFETLQGRTASCKYSDMSECGGGSSCGCSGWSGNCARPTTSCGILPPPPPPPINQ